MSTLIRIILFIAYWTFQIHEVLPELSLIISQNLCTILFTEFYFLLYIILMSSKTCSLIKDSVTCFTIRKYTIIKFTSTFIKETLLTFKINILFLKVMNHISNKAIRFSAKILTCYFITFTFRNANLTVESVIWK